VRASGRFGHVEHAGGGDVLPTHPLPTWDTAREGVVRGSIIPRLFLRAREASGRNVTVEGKATAPSQPLGQINIGGEASDASPFQGNLGEFILYASALKLDQSQLLSGSQLPAYYLKTVTPPNLPKVTPLTERLSIKKSRLGPRTDWIVNASHFPEDAWLAADGNTATRWRTDAPQKSGNWFQVSLKNDTEISGLALDVSCSPDEHPRGYNLETSLDGKTWKSVVSGENDKPLLEIALSQPVKVRHIRIKQTGSSLSAHWSIAELEIFAK
jgi:F5/8 type C domain.